MRSYSRAAVPTPAYGYRRVSKVGARGDDLISPELQTHAVETWAAANNVVIVKWFEDLDETGRSFEKRKVRQMINGIKAGDAEMVVLWKWSRWGRNLQQSSLYIAAVEAAGGEVRAATEDFDPATSVGKFTRDQMLLIAELFSNQIGDGWKDTHAKRRRDGLPHSAAPRYGYTYTRDDGYQIVEDEAEILRDLYDRFVKGATMKSLTVDLNHRGIYTRKLKPWNPTSLGRMLDTGFAAGLIRERSKPGHASNHKSTIKDFDIWRRGAHEPIISEDVFNRYKSIRIANANKPRGLIAAKHPLTGLLLCGECGGGMVSVFSGRHKKHGWTCGSRMRLRATGVLGHAPVTISNMRALALTKAWIESNREGGQDLEVRIKKVPRLPVPESNVANLTRRIEQLIAERTRLTRLRVQGQVDENDYVLLRAENEADLADAERSLEQAQAETVLPGAPPPGIWEGLDAYWDHAAPDVLRGALGEVLAAGVVRPGAFSEDKIVFVPTWRS